MNIHPLVAIVTLLALLVYFYMGLRVGQARTKFNVPAPAMSGNPDFERAFRVQMNTLEWLPIFLVSLWLFAIAWGSDLIAAGIGLVWIVGRVLYLTGYSKAAEARGPGFGIQALATGVLLFGALGKIIWIVIQKGV
jgi:glutathione S-transferase